MLLHNNILYSLTLNSLKRKSKTHYFRTMTSIWHRCVYLRFCYRVQSFGLTRSTNEKAALSTFHHVFSGLWKRCSKCIRLRCLLLFRKSLIVAMSSCLERNQLFYLSSAAQFPIRQFISDSRHVSRNQPQFLGSNGFFFGGGTEQTTNWRGRCFLVPCGYMCLPDLSFYAHVNAPLSFPLLSINFWLKTHFFHKYILLLAAGKYNCLHEILLGIYCVNSF